RRTNRRAVAPPTAAAWLPRMRIRRLATGKSVNRVIVGCRAVARPRVYSGLGMTTVLTLATNRGLTVTDSDALLTDAQTIYASPTSLYLAAPRWVNPAADTTGRAAPRGTTLIHRLDTSSPTTTVPTSNATVPGYPLNQFSLSEYRDHLRVATTQEPEWWSAPAGDEPGQSYVTVLSTANGRLTQTGQVGGLGRNERIYAVRFLGPRGYVVTFRQTDPLYTVDLSDPRAPRVTGELKVNGYSAYLHPIDDDTLIGIGQDATADGVTTGTQVSLFDVSDPARPTRLAQLPLGNGYSEAEDDHLAVLYWAPTGTLAIPLSSWSGPDDREAPFTGAVALTVTRAVGVREQGRIAHPGNWAVRRAVVIGPDLYTVSSGGVGLNRLTDLADEGFTAFR
ncbi:MAG TPA: beta-propeller domain-containing protein, partial [Miltoncostaeaceae bacterium]|nr:beta-propeller domain-containing protein [Miltoncostaeaceae bacterium]